MNSPLGTITLSKTSAADRYTERTLHSVETVVLSKTVIICMWLEGWTRTTFKRLRVSTGENEQSFKMVSEPRDFLALGDVVGQTTHSDIGSQLLPRTISMELLQVREYFYEFVHSGEWTYSDLLGELNFANQRVEYLSNLRSLHGNSFNPAITYARDYVLVVEFCLDIVRQRSR